MAAADREALLSWSRAFVQAHGRRPTRADMPEHVVRGLVEFKNRNAAAERRSDVVPASPPGDSPGDAENDVVGASPPRRREDDDVGRAKEAATAAAATTTEAATAAPPLVDATNREEKKENPFLRQRLSSSTSASSSSLKKRAATAAAVAPSASTEDASAPPQRRPTATAGAGAPSLAAPAARGRPSFLGLAPPPVPSAPATTEEQGNGRDATTAAAPAPVLCPVPAAAAPREPRERPAPRAAAERELAAAAAPLAPPPSTSGAAEPAAAADDDEADVPLGVRAAALLRRAERAKARASGGDGGGGGAGRKRKANEEDDADDAPPPQKSGKRKANKKPSAAASASEAASSFCGVSKPPRSQRGKSSTSSAQAPLLPRPLSFGQNFVRHDFRRRSKKFASSRRSAAASSSSSSFAAGGGGRARPLAGDGADYLEGGADGDGGGARSRLSRGGGGDRCRRCGERGHWASSCAGLLPNGECAAPESAAAAALGDEAFGGDEGGGVLDDERGGRLAFGVGGTLVPATAAAAAGALPGEDEGSEEAALAREAAAADAAAARLGLAPVPAPLLPRRDERGDAPSSAGDIEAAVCAAFGHDRFRGRQADVVSAVLAGRNVLAVLPTGAGKSLCYQAAALARSGTVVVVTPLLALARDQLAHLPPDLPGGILCSEQSRADAVATLAALRNGRLRVLFVAPERLGSPSLRAALWRLCGGSDGGDGGNEDPHFDRPNHEKRHAPLPLVCVDEAHCVDEWGHNFRPAYFRLGRILSRPPYRPRCVLALTATATRATARAVSSALGISDAEGEGGVVIREVGVRPNLRLTVARAGGPPSADFNSVGGVDSLAARRAVASALLSPDGVMRKCERVIVYVPFQASADALSAHLTALGCPAAPYHSGLHARARDEAAADFASGKLRVVAATVAFGMGVDVPGVDGVVHAALPRSVEEYVQQAGRAGRWGSGEGGEGGGEGGASATGAKTGDARCHAIVDDADYRRLRSLCEADGVTPARVARLLEAVFSSSDGGGGKGKRKKTDDGDADVDGERQHDYRILQVGPLCTLLDARAEAVETLLAYLEDDDGRDEDDGDEGRGGDGDEGRGGDGDPRPLVTILPSVGDRVRVAFYRRDPRDLAREHRCVAAVLECGRRAPSRGGWGGGSNTGEHLVPTAALARRAEMPPSEALAALSRLAASGEISMEVENTGRSGGGGGSAARGTVALRVHRRPTSAAALRRLAQRLARRHAAVVSAASARLDAVYRILTSAADEASSGGEGDRTEAAEIKLRSAIDEYFESDAPPVAGPPRPPGDDGEAPSASAAAAAAACLPPCRSLEGLPLRETDRGLAADVHWLLCEARARGSPPIHARAVARILHGVGSPCFPAADWSRCGAWGRYSHVDFARVAAAAAEAAVASAAKARGEKAAAGPAAAPTTAAAATGEKESEREQEEENAPPPAFLEDGAADDPDAFTKKGGAGRGNGFFGGSWRGRGKGGGWPASGGGRGRGFGRGGFGRGSRF